jgi:hypothetical protein
MDAEGRAPKVGALGDTGAIAEKSLPVVHPSMPEIPHKRNNIPSLSFRPMGEIFTPPNNP